MLTRLELNELLTLDFSRNEVNDLSFLSKVFFEKLRVFELSENPLLDWKGRFGYPIKPYTISHEKNSIR